MLRVSKEITQRQLRNESGEVMRALDNGDTFVVTRNGVAVGQLTPIARRRFVSREAALAAFAGAAAIDADSFREDLDAEIDQDPAPRARPAPLRARPDRHVGRHRARKVLPHALPAKIAIASITLAELAAGPHATDDHA